MAVFRKFPEVRGGKHKNSAALQKYSAVASTEVPRIRGGSGGPSADPLRYFIHLFFQNSFKFFSIFSIYFFKMFLH